MYFSVSYLTAIYSKSYDENFTYHLISHFKMWFGYDKKKDISHCWDATLDTSKWWNRFIRSPFLIVALICHWLLVLMTVQNAYMTGYETVI